MSQLSQSHLDKLPVALAATLLAASGGWMAWHHAEITRLEQLPVTVELAGAAYGRSVQAPRETSAALWSKPVAQSSGSGWLYEVFTPPVIYYHPQAKSFAVTPPLDVTGEGAPFGLELLDVKLAPYRLQLVGYFGGPDDYLAAFVSPEQPETLLARRGQRFGPLGLTLKSLEVRKVVVAHTDAWPVYDVAAFAVLQDEKTGMDVVLDSRERKLTDTPLAVLRLPGAAPRTLHEGETFTDATARYLVERIQLDPPEVVITRQSRGLPVPETRILRPAGQFASQPPQHGKFPVPPETGLATNHP